MEIGRLGLEAVGRTGPAAQPRHRVHVQQDRKVRGAPAEITREIQERIRVLLPDPVPSTAEASTGDFPAIREEVLTPTRQPGERQHP